MGGLKWRKFCPRLRGKWLSKAKPKGVKNHKNLPACNGAKRWLYHVSIATDQWFNAITGGAADETISSRAYRHITFSQPVKKRWRVVFRLIEGLFFWEKNHCKTAYESELSRKQYPDFFKEKSDAA